MTWYGKQLEELSDEDLEIARDSVLYGKGISPETCLRAYEEDQIEVQAELRRRHIP